MIPGLILKGEDGRLSRMKAWQITPAVSRCCHTVSLLKTCLVWFDPPPRWFPGCLVPAQVSVVVWRMIPMLLILYCTQTRCYSANVCVHPWFPSTAAVLVVGLGEVRSRCYACISLTTHLPWPELESSPNLPWLSCWGLFWSTHHTCHFACCFDTWKWAHRVPRELLTMPIGICYSDPCVWLAIGGFIIFFPLGSRCFLALYNFQVYMIYLGHFLRN